eukprot:TRINITY_DN55860_c0_g1_i1.p1 TRINITY_DN55860_c0_g1~~TRINITY_DN55860_c0_g1_i1.p1  ORF type:complete len:253 (-),score=48.45 TRINITY_DN55860_c0_g1_i1:38-796(-)
MLVARCREVAGGGVRRSSGFLSGSFSTTRGVSQPTYACSRRVAVGIGSGSHAIGVATLGAASAFSTSRLQLPYPRAAVAGVICHSDGARDDSNTPASGRRYLIVKRARPPRVGRWSFPGGKLELGETVAVGAVREVEEECGLTAASLRWHSMPITATDAIFFPDIQDDIAAAAEVDPEFHYVISHCFAWHDPSEETASAGDDASDLRWCSLAELTGDARGEGLWFTAQVVSVVRLAERLIESGVIRPQPEAW